MYKIQLKYGCNPNQKPSCIFMENGKDLPVEVLCGKPQNEFPVTDKADRENHGIGLANIKSTAEKYQGTMDFKAKGRVFILSVMMKNEGRNEDGFWSDR